MSTDYERLASRLVQRYRERNRLYRIIDDIFYVRWSLPEGMPDWVQEVKSTDPRDAMMTAARVLSTLEPSFHIDPMYSNEASREWASDLETALKWNYVNVAKRGSTNPHWQAVLNAVRYAQPVIQVVYLPAQIKAMGEMGKNTNRMKGWKKYGDFSLLVHDPANVYPLWSDFGLEAVLLVRLQTADEFKRTWGSLAKDFGDTTNADGAPLWVTSYDLIDYDRRVVWGVVGEGEAATRQEVVFQGKSHVVMQKDNDMGFIPYAIRRWGDDTAPMTDQQVLPLVSGIAMSNQWDMLNIMFSLDATLAWKRAARPIGAHSSPSRMAPHIDATEPMSTIEMGPGETMNFLPPERMDERIANQYGNFRQLIWQGTVARALQSLEFPGNTAYSTVNQVLQAATSSIAPYRVLAEEVIAEASHLQMCWVQYWGEHHDKKAALYATYPKKSKKYGEEIMIPWNEIDPYEVNVRVTLRPDVPVDRQQQVNTAAILYERFPLPADAVLEPIGFENMDELIEQRFQEDLDRAYMQAEDMRPMKEVETEYKVRLLQEQAAIEQQMMQEQQARQEAQNAQQNAQQNPVTENVRGMGNNPAAGGGPPIQAAPGQATREASPNRR